MLGHCRFQEVVRLASIRRGGRSHNPQYMFCGRMGWAAVECFFVLPGEADGVCGSRSSKLMVIIMNHLRPPKVKFLFCGPTSKGMGPTSFLSKIGRLVFGSCNIGWEAALQPSSLRVIGKFVLVNRNVRIAESMATHRSRRSSRTANHSRVRRVASR